LIERVDNTLQSLQTLYKAQRDMARELAELRQTTPTSAESTKKEIVLLKKEIEDFKKWKDDLRKNMRSAAGGCGARARNAFGAIVSGLCRVLTLSPGGEPSTIRALLTTVLRPPPRCDF